MLISMLLLTSVGAIAALAVALTVRSKRDFVHANEVVPGVRSPAPASWAGAHSTEAKMHRRLGTAVRSALNNPRLVELGLSDQTRKIESEALAIDERLVAAAGLPASRREDAVNALAPHVAALEDAVSALVTGTTISQSKALLERATSEADIKLQALTAARAEVEQLDQGATRNITANPDEEPGTATR